MADESYQNPHAAREAKLVRLLNREIATDIYGGEETTRNGTGLILAVAPLVFLAIVIIIGLFYFLGG